jgi:hypothetical protein
MKRFITSLVLIAALIMTTALQAADQFVTFQSQDNAYCLYPSSQGAIQLVMDQNDYPGIARALNNLGADLAAVTGRSASKVVDRIETDAPVILVGSYEKSSYIQQLVKRKALGVKDLKGMREKYIITTVDASVLDKNRSGQMLVIAGSDKRGTEFGIYELSRQLGVSPWAWWADMPVARQQSIYILPGVYTDGEPTVRYRGLFLNDEAPCLSGWVNEKFPDSQCENLPVDPWGNTYAKGFNHLFYEHVFELLLRLKANYLWPAMWGNAFYFDDPLNGPLADEMGIIMGTSHHEPMARNHQEWVRYKHAKMREAGAKSDDEAPAEARWDYAVNKEVIDQFFREGIERAKNTEDLITIGMRGDGDTGLGGKEGFDHLTQNRDEYNKKLLENVISNQRKIIAKVTGKKADKTPQMWALYKEVQHLYDIGLDVPDDVLIMLCDDNWGDIRRVPEANVSATRSKASLLNRKGGWGMYYHVDYVGGPRNTKWANVTTTNHLWEQMRLCYEYGIDDLWILNVGDLKPMEQPIDLFLKMAWRPEDYEAVESVHEHALSFCQEMMGEQVTTAEPTPLVQEVTRLLETYLRYNSRVTPELLDWRTYNLQSGEWEQAMLQYKALEADAYRLWAKVPTVARDAYHQLVFFPIQAMANLYEMYYAQAQNLYLAGIGDPRANCYADKVEQCFARDAELTQEYHSINGGKWNHLMDQTHIGYVIWQSPQVQVCPKVVRVGEGAEAVTPQYVFRAYNGAVSIEAEHYYAQQPSADGKWTVLPTLGRTLSGVALLPHNASCEGASLDYAFQAEGLKVDSVKVHIITNSTLPFLRKEGHRYTLQLDGGSSVEVNYNSRYVEENTNEMYAIAATRIIETVTTLPITRDALHHLVIRPLDPGLVVEKVVIDLGGYDPSHLKGNESPRIKR